MTTLTTAQQISNCRLFLECWDRVPPEEVIPELEYWSSSRPTDCGALHCAGGWLPHFPEFRALGVYEEKTGAPAMQETMDRPYCYGWELAGYLFNSEVLFDRRGYTESPDLSDHAVVRRRFVLHISSLESSTL